MKCEHDRIKSQCSICSIESVYHQYEYKAKQRNLTFRISLAEFEGLIGQGRCYYCGEYEVLGLDRVDNRISYLPTNVVAACAECNFMKRNMEKFRFLRRAALISAHQDKLRKQKQGIPPPPQAVDLPEVNVDKAA